ncbi:MAG TPA: efflux transporter outer membrane subunit [Terriglobales bacterium]|jgi:NodT family efflux transporter outer membrane factor (OMF) lipoprotein
MKLVTQKYFLRKSGVLAVAALAACFTGCLSGPRYSRAPVPTPPAYKEVPPDWKTAQPSDQLARGKWWEIFQDPQLNVLEDKINVSNQNLKAAQAQFFQARAQVRYNRAEYYPYVSVNPSATRVKQSQNRPLKSTTNDYTDLILPLDVSYEPDMWGRVRRTVEESRENAQASAADLESVSLSLHADLALDYFELRSLDAESQLLNSNVEAFEKALQLTQNRYQGGIASAVDVAQAQTQLETTRAQAIDLHVQRAQNEHAIATLVGEPASTFAITVSPILQPPPVIPTGLPSQLLERRPDIAAAERRMAAANAQIGVAKTAYYPIFNLAGAGGFEGTSITNWFSGPSILANVGASAVAPIFEGGRRRALNEQAQAAYDQSVATYRQTALGAFQEVEDNLAALRILESEAKTQDVAVKASQNSLQLSTNRYKGGVSNYLEVITAQSIALTDQRAAVDILRRRVAAAVLLIKAVGGGWGASQLPTDFTKAAPSNSPAPITPNSSSPTM